MGPREHRPLLPLLALCAAGPVRMGTLDRPSGAPTCLCCPGGFGVAHRGGHWLCWGLAGLTLGVSAPVLSGLPATVSVLETAEPGAAIAKFSLACGNESSDPGLTLQSTPPSAFFNLALNATTPAHYSAQITLSSSAALDARQVGQYTLDLEATCPGETPARGQIFVWVRETDGPPQCMARFASPGGEQVDVPEDVAPLTPIYTVVLRRTASGLKFTIQDNDTPLTISSVGQVLAPQSGFTPAQASQSFRLQILVTDGSSRNCSGAVTVMVLPVHRPRVNFTAAWRSVTVQEKGGAMQLITQVQAVGDNVRYEIIAPAAHSLYTIDTVTGEIRNTYELDLQRFPAAAHTQLLVRAYDMLHPSDSDTVGINITVLPANALAPRCSPAVFLAQVSEGTSVGRTLATLTCTDPDGSNSSLRYQLEGDQRSRYSFRMQGPQLQVNETLDYDSAASANFQYTATILVTDSGQPPKTTRVPVLVTVTPENEHPPACPASATFSVPEDAAFGNTVGRVNGTDRDYPFDSIEYSIAGGTGTSPPAFYIGPRTGEIHVLGPLDYERQKLYSLTVQLQDMADDLDPRGQLTVLCDITIQVQDVNDQVPCCTPPFQELAVYSTRDPLLPLAQLQCSDEDDSTVLPLTYAIVGGNTDGYFRLEGSSLLHSAFTQPAGSAVPRTFELLVEVTDSRSVPRHSTTATLIVHVTPWTTTTPSTTTTRTTLRKGPLVVTRTERFWAPPPWFVAVLTVSGALLLAALAWLAWKLLCRAAPGEPAQPLLQDRALSELHAPEGNKAAPREPGKETGPASVHSLLQAKITSSTASPEHAAGSERAPPPHTPLAVSGHGPV
ncbi:cadherin-related family member 4 [Emydura macquarii macquarii]|uniref:cadherin-related family member 4 n=1 Tax=Emydura macquarii macquarii TaxID=1129001 RepID=UPI00352B753B